MASEELSQHLMETKADINTRLIYLVKECPFIYDTSDPKHKDRNLLEKRWTFIASQINLSVEEAKTKWQRLRNNFSKAIDRRKKTPRSGSAATKLQKPWMYEADMDFLRSHLHYHTHRASSKSLARQVPAAVESDPLSPQPDSADLSVPDSEDSTDTSILHSPAPPARSGGEQDTFISAKARKRDSSDLDTAAVLSFINRTSTRGENQEDPAVGWFKSLLPMYNTLTHIEKLEFQSKVILELRSLLLAKEQSMSHQPKRLGHPSNYTKSNSQNTASNAAPEYKHSQNYH